MSKRYEHFMFPTKNDKQPGAIVGLECDVVKIVRKPGPAVEHEQLRQWYAFSGVRRNGEWVQARDYNGTTAEEFWQLLERLVRHTNNVWIMTGCSPSTWAHMELWERLEDGRILLKGEDHSISEEEQEARRRRGSPLLVLADPINCINIRLQGVAGSATFVDARNYGLEYGSTGDNKADCSARWYRALVQYATAFESGGLGALQVTAASQAMFTFRHSFMDHAILCHTHKDCMELEDQGYVGGRSEVHRLGEIAGPIYQLDFTSMYGYACCSETLPVRLREYRSSRMPGEDWERRQDLPSVATVQLYTDEPSFPCPRNGLVVYPTGTFWTTLYGPELWRAVEGRCVTAVAAHAYYEHEPALSSFAIYWLTRRDQCRREGWKDLETLCKRMIVGLVGKLGQRGRQWVDDEDVLADAPYMQWKSVGRGGVVTKYRSVAWRVQSEEESLWGPFAVPAIAGWITSFGRMHLWKAIECAGWSNVYAVETDGLFVNQRGFDRLGADGWIASNAPGLLRLEETSESGWISGYQSYTFGSKSVCTGVPRGTDTSDAPRGYGWFRSGVADALRDGNRPTAIRRLLRHEREGVFRHGKVANDGTITPWVLPEDLNSFKGQ